MFWLIVTASLFLLELIQSKGYLFWWAMLALVNYLCLPTIALQHNHIYPAHDDLVLLMYSGLAWLLLAGITSVLWYRYLHCPMRNYDATDYRRNAHDFVQGEFNLTRPMIKGKSYITLEDSIWPVWARKTIDLPTGTRVKVFKTNGVILLVKPV